MRPYLCNSFIYTYCRPFCMLNAHCHLHFVVSFFFALSLWSLRFIGLVTCALCILWGSSTTWRIHNVTLWLPLEPHLFNWIGMSWHIWQSLFNFHLKGVFALISLLSLSPALSACLSIFVVFLSIDSNQANVGALSANVDSSTSDPSGIRPAAESGGKADGTWCLPMRSFASREI